MQDFNEVKGLYDENILPTYGRHKVAFERGAGSRLWDTDGKEYIDFASGIAVTSVGHSHPAWVSAVCEQAGVLTHVSNLFYTKPGGVLAQKLTSLAGMSGLFFCNSGAEAVEGAIKAARKYSSDKHGTGRHTIITLEGSFHGRTLAALTATGQEKFHKHFHPFVQGFRYVPPNDTAALEAELNAGDVCAFLFEPVLGEGGIIPLEAEYLQKAARLCEERDILLISDEVQTGIGRTGAWFGFQNSGIKPDALTFAKGIAGGLPLGGFMVGEKLRGTLGAGDHGTTFGGNAICAAAALAVLEILEPVLPHVNEKGAYIREKIAAMNLPCITEIRGAGLMLGLKLSGLSNTEAVAKLLEAGLVALTAGADILRFLPSLTIETQDIDAGLEIFEKVLRTV